LNLILFLLSQEKNDFEVSKNLNTDLKIILLDYQNNYVHKKELDNNNQV